FALANVLVNENGEFEEIFKEGSSTKSCTREFESRNFEDEKRGIRYTIIDTPGISDTNPENEKEVYRQMVKAICFIERNLNQVLFITSDRFTAEEKRAYELLWDAFFNEDVTNFTTIVRTKFLKFKNPEACRKDIEEIDGKFAEVIKSCNESVVHVNNPSLDVDDEDELELGKKKRKESREKLLNHLASCNDVYSHELPNISDAELQRVEELKEKLSDTIKEIKRADKEIKNRIEKAIKRQEWGKETKATGDKIWEAKAATQAGMKAGFIVGIFAGPESVLMGTTVGLATDGIASGTCKIVGNITSWMAEGAKKRALLAKDYLVDKYENHLKGIVESAKDLFLILRDLEKKDPEELQRLYNEYVVELGEKIKVLQTKLEIRQLFKEVQEEQSLQQLQLVEVNK
ncbi:MAG: hypothetical protein MRERV_62c002, partial [Mycoplasmataceae bacterium RV_VA103A]